VIGHTSSFPVGGQPEEEGRWGREEETNAPEGGGGVIKLTPRHAKLRTTLTHMTPQMNRTSLQRDFILIYRSYKPWKFSTRPLSMKDQRWKTMVVEGKRRGEDDVRNGGVWKAIYRECGPKIGWEVINAVKKRGKTCFLDLTTNQNLLWTRFTDTDAVRKIKSGMHLRFTEYVIRIYTRFTNTGVINVGLDGYNH